MSNNPPTQNFDAAPEGQVAGTSSDTTATTARTNLSNFAVDAMKEAASQGSTRAVENGVSAIADGVAGTTGSLQKMQENLGKDGIQGRVGQISGEGAINKMIEKGSSDSISQAMKIGSFKREVTDKDRAEAKKLLEKDLSELIPEADRKVLTELQGALIDGDLKKFGETLKGLPPEQVDKFVKALNDQLNKNENMGGVELSRDSQGNVLVYGEKGNTAVSIDPKTGEASLRAVERQDDGSVVLKPGEIINRKADEVMKDLGNEATQSLTQYRFDNIRPMPMPTWPPHGKPGWDPKPHFPHGGGDLRPMIRNQDGSGTSNKPHFPKEQSLEQQ